MIFLNGASSSGKSALAKALQRALEEPFLHVRRVRPEGLAQEDRTARHTAETTREMSF
ncbi:chloramphenicol phosphotransferase CPT family protein [Streptosporangium subroseum]|uniref:chloramphenicol phosphotransferase CPT family protein n=1 Tax=Streptosporangium subroseum TaxID=106412 RepID=UPI001C534189|nr:chloramphenicol phosphotransferase CPT family protein [Streptosporangium subroseum]